jgi:HD-GYP domain-containing protein (c-di-GMP phosphodiesterase class II)
MTGSQGDRERHLRDAIEALTRAAESREFHNSGPGELVGRYSEMIARAMAMADEEVADITFAARVHDVGKIIVPERVLNKYGPRNENEEYLLRLHPNVGARILATIPDSENLQRAVEHHHESFDGGGYPSKLSGENIPLPARIIAIADAYVNLTTDRGLASAKSSEQALAELQKMSGTRYDGMLVRILVRQLKSERTSPNLGT